MDSVSAPTPTGRGLLIVRNAASGAAVARADPSGTFAARLPDAVVRELADGEDLADVVAKAMDSDAPPAVLGIYGGDGSVSGETPVMPICSRSYLAAR